jgi:HEAT repeat protein
MRMPHARFRVWTLIGAVAVVAVLTLTMTRFLGDSPQRWITTLRSNPSAPAREDAASRIVESADRIDPSLAVPTLTAALSDPSPRVRRSAVVALSLFSKRSTSTIPALVEALKDDDIAVRILAVEALGEAPKTPEIGTIAIPALVETLSDRNNLVRCRAARKLVAWGEGAKGVSAMVEIIRGQGAAETREDVKLSNCRSAIASLETIGADARDAIPALIEATKDEDDETRVAAASVLASFGEHEVALPVLRWALGSKSNDLSVRTMAQKALEKIEAQGATDRSAPKDLSVPQQPGR